MDGRQDKSGDSFWWWHCGGKALGQFVFFEAGIYFLCIDELVAILAIRFYLHDEDGHEEPEGLLFYDASSVLLCRFLPQR